MARIVISFRTLLIKGVVQPESEKTGVFLISWDGGLPYPLTSTYYLGICIPQATAPAQPQHSIYQKLELNLLGGWKTTHLKKDDSSKWESSPNRGEKKNIWNYHHLVNKPMKS